MFMTGTYLIQRDNVPIVKCTLYSKHVTRLPNL